VREFRTSAWFADASLLRCPTLRLSRARKP
jgi:hypothetical protein